MADPAEPASDPASVGHTVAMEGLVDADLPPGAVLTLPLPPASESPMQDEEATLLSAQLARARLTAVSPATGP